MKESFIWIKFAKQLDKFKKASLNDTRLHVSMQSIRQIQDGSRQLLLTLNGTSAETPVALKGRKKVHRLFFFSSSLSLYHLIAK